MISFFTKQESFFQQAAKTPNRVRLGTHGDCTFYAYRNLDDITCLWRQLGRGGIHSPFQSLAWVQAVIKAMAQSPASRLRQHVFVIGFAGIKPVVLFPFTIHHGVLGPRLTWLGEKMSDYNGMIVDRGHATVMPNGLVCRVVTMLREAFPAIQAVHLIRNPAGLFDTDQTREPGSTLAAAEFKSHAVSLERDWTELYARLRSGKSRQRLRGKYRSLKKLGDVQFRQVRCKHERTALARQILEWKSGQLLASGRRDPFGSTTAPSAARRAIETAVPSRDNNALKVFGLFLDGQPVAGMLAFAAGGTFYYFVSAYTPTLDGKYSIGVQLLVRTLELASRAGLKRYDFLIGDEPYKADWCDTEIPLVNYSRPFSLQGKLICTSLKLRLACKKLVLEKGWLSHIARQTLKIRRKPDASGSAPESCPVTGILPSARPSLQPEVMTARNWLKTSKDA